MAQQGKVVRFRRRAPRTTSRSRRRWSRRLRRLIAPGVVVLLLFATVVFGLLKDGRVVATQGASRGSGGNVEVTWVDGDSGRLDGVEFRLHGVDAPEGSPARAKCKQERDLSIGARQAARRFTDGKTVKVTRRHGKDTYGRQVVALSVEGRDVADTLVAAGSVKRWNFDGGERKPDWCP